MKSFREFVKERFTLLESIYYFDEHVFKPIYEHKYHFTPNELVKIDAEYQLITESDEKNYLQNDEEIELIKVYQEDPFSPEAQEAITKLINNKMGYIYSQVNKHILKCPWKQSHRDDLVALASEALVKAVENFDPAKGNIFNAFVKKYIFTALMNAYNPERESSVMAGQKDETGQTLKMDSVDRIVPGSRGAYADKDMTLGDLIPADQIQLPGDDSDDIHDMRLAALHDWISELSDKEAKALRMYFTPYGEVQHTFEEIGKEIGMTKAGVSQMFKKKLIPWLTKKASAWKDKYEDAKKAEEEAKDDVKAEEENDKKDKKDDKKSKKSKK